MANCGPLYDDLYLLMYSYLQPKDKIAYGYVCTKFKSFFDTNVEMTKNKIKEKFMQYIHDNALRLEIRRNNFIDFLFDFDDYLLLKNYFILHKYYDNTGFVVKVFDIYKGSNYKFIFELLNLFTESDDQHKYNSNYRVKLCGCIGNEYGLIKNDSSYWRNYNGCKNNCFGKLQYNINGKCVCYFANEELGEILDTINKYLITDQIFPSVSKLFELDQKDDYIEFIETSEILWDNDLFNYLKSLNV
jgi:hypothetical protein